MSSIIKGQRVRNQTLINLAERASLEKVYYEGSEEVDCLSVAEQEIDEEHLTQESIDEQEKILEMNRQAILDEAREQAALLLNQAKQEANSIVQSAEKTKETFLEEAQTQKEQIILEAEEMANHILEAAQKEKEALIQGTEGEMVETLIGLLQYLIGEEIYHNTDWVNCIVKKVLCEEQFEEEVKVLLSPTVFKSLKEQDQEKLKAAGQNITLEMDASLNETSCKVITKQGNMEYDVTKGLDRVVSDIRILENLNKE